MIETNLSVMGNEYGVLHCVTAGGGYNKLIFGSGTSLHIQSSEYAKNPTSYYIQMVFPFALHIKKYQGH